MFPSRRWSLPFSKPCDAVTAAPLRLTCKDVNLLEYRLFAVGSCHFLQLLHARFHRDQLCQQIFRASSELLDSSNRTVPKAGEFLRNFLHLASFVGSKPQCPNPEIMTVSFSLNILQALYNVRYLHLEEKAAVSSLWQELTQHTDNVGRIGLQLFGITDDDLKIRQIALLDYPSDDIHMVHLLRKFPG